MGNFKICVDIGLLMIYFYYGNLSLLKEYISKKPQTLPCNFRSKIKRDNVFVWSSSILKVENEHHWTEFCVHFCPIQLLCGFCEGKLIPDQLLVNGPRYVNARLLHCPISD